MNKVKAKTIIKALKRNALANPKYSDKNPVKIIPIPIPKSKLVKKVELAAPLLSGLTRLLIIAWNVGITIPKPSPIITAAI